MVGVEGEVDGVELAQGFDQGFSGFIEKGTGAVGRERVGLEGLGQGVEIRDVGGERRVRRMGIMGIMGMMGRMGRIRGERFIVL